jgi:glycogen debranching enzyme
VYLRSGFSTRENSLESIHSAYSQVCTLLQRLPLCGENVFRTWLLLAHGDSATSYFSFQEADMLNGPMRSTSERLAQKRYVASGDRAYIMGTTDGDFPPLGTQISGEMGGVWAHPIKLLVGYWFSVNGAWLLPAQRFTSGAGYVQFEFMPISGLVITRTEFAPDGLPVVLVALTLRNSAQTPRQFALSMQVRSQLLAAYPWSATTPTAEEHNACDQAAYQADTGTLVFRRPDVDWCALVAASVPPTRGVVGGQSWGTLSEATRAGYSQQQFSSGGELGWQLALAAGESRTLWIGVAGSHVSYSEAAAALHAALDQPHERLRAQSAERCALLTRSRLTLPEPQLAAAFEWGILNMADLRRTVTHVQIRDVQEGKAYPPPSAALPSLSGIGDGYPDYPWFFGTGSGYIIYPLVIAGMWETAMAHARLLREASRVVNGRTGKVIHELATDGSVRFGTNAANGNANETGLFATAVDLIWCWSGDDAFRDEMYEFVVDGMRYVTQELDRDGDHWPEGLGIAERPGMGSEQLDVVVDTWKGLQALQHMAEHKGDIDTAAWARAQADAIAAAFDRIWWLPGDSLYADSRCNEDDVVSAGERRDKGWTNVCKAIDQLLQQRVWISVKPMETAIAPAEHAHAALDRLESPAFGDAGGLFLVGEHGGPDGKAVRKAWTVMTGVMAIAEANYGRLEAQQALRFMRAIAATLDLEMPGALPELAPSPDYDPFGPMPERMMLMQAWATYGIGWPIIANLLGIAPMIPSGKLSVVPQLPPDWASLAVRTLRVGQASITASAARTDRDYRTTVEAPAGWTLTIGHTLAANARVESVELDGRPAAYVIVDSIRGREVRVETTTGGERRLVVKTRT